MRNDWFIERPDSDYPDYADYMEYEVWDDDGRYLIEEDNEEDLDD